MRFVHRKMRGPLFPRLRRGTLLPKGRKERRDHLSLPLPRGEKGPTRSVGKRGPLTRVGTSVYVPVMFLSTQRIYDDVIARNCLALKSVVAELLAVLALYGGIDARLVPRAVHTTLLRVLRPAESALRRLIVIAAWGVSAEAVVPRSARKGADKKPRAGTRNASASFQLFDPRMRFNVNRVTYRTKPFRVFFIEPDPPFAPMFIPPSLPPAPPVVPEVQQISVLRICRRLKALSAALEDMPQQAKRLARWRFRRENLGRPTFTSPLRPGRPPGHRKVPRYKVDFILDDCDKYAPGALKPDTS